ncbi:RagB/SusD family nutrient uptake outer membrane protein [Puteibacter caeruleilacunae]|nr:RagB/SusD family nutrient uptake outer membrane protein [Puteibacter caeruleilacunae]
MKTRFKYILFIAVLCCTYGCNDLDLASLDKANSESWYATQDHFRYSLNDLYSSSYWRSDSDFWTDDVQKRTSVDEVLSGNLSAEWGSGKNIWFALYKGISRANTIITELDNSGELLAEAVKNQFYGEAYVAKAVCFSYLITHYGDVPYYDEFPGIEESYSVPRTDMNTIKAEVYRLYDEAARLLPESYDDIVYATKGVAYGYKARTALHLGDYDVAAQAAKACMDLGVYELHSSFRELFLSSTRTSPEIMLSFPRAEEFDSKFSVNWWMPRTVPGGYAGNNPTWQLLAGFYCRDGLPIDESPLFDPHNPFKDRDPRLLETLIPFGKLTEGDDRDEMSGFMHVGYEYNPHPSVTGFVLANGDEILNKDTRATQTYASFNGLLRRKGIDEEWADDMRADPNDVRMRYAEVLLTYAEAKIELNDIDQSVLDVMNAIRERGYADSEFDYPQITTTDQAELRKIVRIERRSEFVFEGLRYMDIIRWRLAEKALVGNAYGLLTATPVGKFEEPQGELVDKVVNQGHWFWGLTPEIDEDGIADFEPLLQNEMCRVLFIKNFDASKQYLFPIPDADRKLNESLTQNPGY